MRALAEFIMRGRMQAALVAFCGNLLPLMSPAAVGLVSLRKGLFEGLWAVLWALLPLLFALYAGGFSPVVILASIAALAVVPAAAEVLKVSASWCYTLLFISAVSGGLAILLDLLFGAELAALQELLAQFFVEMQSESEIANKFVPEHPFILGLLGYVVALNAVLSLMLARWWQALLYNPGGFQQEFHQLRLGVKQAAILLVIVVACQLGSPQYLGWSELFGLPLLLSGIALVHFTVANRQLGGHWLVIFYIGLLTIGPLSLMLIGVGFIDSIMNFRSRLSRDSEQ